MPSDVTAGGEQGDQAEVEVRRGTPEDAEALARIHLASRRSAPMPPLVHTDDEVVAWMRERVELDEIWVAESPTGEVGYARFTGGWLDDLYVEPAHMRQGIGGMLLDTVKALHPEGFGLWVFETNAPARRFYARHGLVELERTDGKGNEERRSDVHVVWGGQEPLRYLRSLIDEADEELGSLLERRAALTAAVQRVKAAEGRSPRDPDREREIAERLGLHATRLSPEGLLGIVHAIVRASLEAVTEAAPAPASGARPPDVGGSVGPAPGDHLE